jgi:hypothetical protein
MGIGANQMDNLIDFETYFNVQSVYTEIGHFYLDFLLTGLCAFVISLIYQKYGRTISNRKIFAANFIILALTTMLIISIVKSSLALSLGLVGALSIVRFRSAIKEPEELTFLFLTMSMGVGFGAGQRMLTLLAFFAISLFLITRGTFHKSTQPEYNMLLNITSEKVNEADLDKVTDALKKFAEFVSLKRLDRSQDQIEILLYVKFNNISDLNSAATSLEALDSNLRMSFIEDKGLFA